MVNQVLEGISRQASEKSCENKFQRTEVKRKEIKKKYHSRSFTEEIQNCSMKLSSGEANSITEDISTGEGSLLAVLTARSPSSSFTDLF